MEQELLNTINNALVNTTANAIKNFAEQYPHTTKCCLEIAMLVALAVHATREAKQSITNGEIKAFLS